MVLQDLGGRGERGADAIYASGQSVGFSGASAVLPGGEYGFLLTPAPEPSTWMMVLAGFAGPRGLRDYGDTPRDYGDTPGIVESRKGAAA